jgi:hypothetical protein
MNVLTGAEPSGAFSALFGSAVEEDVLCATVMKRKRWWW